MVIIGGGEAGARAAVALRENGFSGEITIVGDEVHPPYERPPLSKAMVIAEADPNPHLILPEERFAALNIRLVSGMAATTIDRLAHRVILADGRHIPYDRLLLATGANPRRLTIAGTAENTVFYLRRFSDVLTLRSRLRPGCRLVVIGGGFIGLEVAANARSRGCEVTVIESALRLLTRAVPKEIATTIAERHEIAGVRLLTGAQPAGLELRGDKIRVVLTNGECIEADATIAGIGAVPEITIAEAAGLTIDNGIAVDATMCTDDPDIFAAGDCCSFPHALYSGRRIRLEAWRNAQDQGTVAARNMLGADEHYAAVPWFWSDQYELTIQIAGLAEEGCETVTREIRDDLRLHFHLADDGRLVAVSAVGPNAAIARDIRIAEMLIARRIYPERHALAASNVNLKALLSS